jgi:hypothetical protein
MIKLDPDSLRVESFEPMRMPRERGTPVAMSTRPMCTDRSCTGDFPDCIDTRTCPP